MWIDRRAFLRISALTGAGLAIHPSLSNAATPDAVPHGRLDRLKTGANICNWFVSGGSNEHFKSYISDDEAAAMARMGLKHVRLCVAPDVVMDRSSGQVVEEHAERVDAAIRMFHRAGLLVIVDLHNGDRAAELDREWQKAFVHFWGLYAARLSTFDPELTLLEIINEPVFDRREEEWNALNAQLAAVIRRNAPRHTIVTSGPNWGGIDGLKKLQPLPDKNVIYSFHFYDPFTFTHQGATWTDARVRPLQSLPYPSTPEAVEPLLADLESAPLSKKIAEAYGQNRWNRDKLSARFHEAVEWGSKNRAPVYCGEFGVFPAHSKPQHRANWFRDFASILSENSVGCAVWAWDDGFGLGRKIVNGKPVVDSVVAKALGLATE